MQVHETQYKLVIIPTRFIHVKKSQSLIFIANVFKCCQYISIVFVSIFVVYYNIIFLLTGSRWVMPLTSLDLHPIIFSLLHSFS